MKTLVLGDIHGQLIWMDIIQKENPDKVIFLGDYVASHDDIPYDQQLSNLEDILNYKKDNPDKVTLLRGNHDGQHLGYHWAQCSGWEPKVWQYMSESNFKERFLRLTQWVKVDDDLGTIFSHAGVSQVWMDNSGIKDVHDINNLEPSELFGFIPDSIHDMYGESVTQPPTWIRPYSLCKCNVLGYDQVVGHTPQTCIKDIGKAAKGKHHIILCDTLGCKEYLVIKDGAFIPVNFIV